MKKIRTVLFSLLIVAPGLLVGQDDATFGWPREMEAKGYTLRFYQPELESYKDNVLDGRMAVSLKRKDDPIFGAVWFKADVITDLDNRTVQFRNLKFTDAKFPDIDTKNYQNLSALVTEKIEDWHLTMSLDRFLAAMDSKKSEVQASANGYKHDPPKIFFRTSPAVLISMDGGPTLKPTEEENLLHVINTPYFLVMDTNSSTYYLNGGDWWYQTKDLNGTWNLVESPPRNVRDYEESLSKDASKDVDSLAATLDAPPEIILSQEPAELLQSAGDPVFENVDGADGISYVSNSENDILLDNTSNTFYVLIAGRWFKATELNSSEWEFVNPYELPKKFQSISPDSKVASVRVSIPQTNEAKEAVLENSIPQTAEIDRSTATFSAKYDGDPEFEKIDDMDVYYAKNTDKDVVMYKKTYYAVENGVWFVSTSPYGEWKVCDNVPDRIYDIPASSPVHNVTYVYVYDSTPDIVYVGYTPGYYGSYVSYGCVVYGSGWYYRPWYGGYYYPRPVTYGYGVHYNPYTGWGFSVGLSYGWIHYSAYPYYRGYWGAGGYRYGYRHGYGAGYRHGYRRGYYAGRHAGGAAGYRNAGQSRQSVNAYRNRSNGVRSTGTASRSGSVTRARPVQQQAAPNAGSRSSAANNVYTDRSGNTYRRDNNGGWQKRDNANRNWQSTRPASTGQHSQLNRSYQSRSRGTTRTNNYQRSRTATPRGGGVRRR